MIFLPKNAPIPPFFALSALLFVIACSGTSPQNSASPVQDDVVQTLLERQILTSILAERRIAGVRGPLLQEDDNLKESARNHSLDMATRNFFSHINPDGDGPLERHRKTVTFVQGRIGENIWSSELAPGQEPNLNVLARRSVAGWMGSTDHRTLLLDPSMENVGVGVAFNSKWVFVTLLMQSP